MGNQLPIQLYQNDSVIQEIQTRFTITSNHKNQKISYLTNKYNKCEYLLKQININDEIQKKQLLQLLKLKKSKSTKYLWNLTEYKAQKSKSYCSNQFKIYLIYEKPFKDLKQEMLQRKIKNINFTQQQIIQILETGILALKYLKEINQPHQEIITTNFFMTNRQSIQLSDPFLNSHSIGYNNIQLYHSPQKLEFINNNSFEKYDWYSSDLYSLGMIGLELVYLQSMTKLYKRNKQIDKEKLCQKISLIKYLKLKKYIQSLLGEIGIRNQFANGFLEFTKNSKNNFQSSTTITVTNQDNPTFISKPFESIKVLKAINPPIIVKQNPQAFNQKVLDRNVNFVDKNNNYRNRSFKQNSPIVQLKESSIFNNINSKQKFSSNTVPIIMTQQKKVFFSTQNNTNNLLPYKKLENINQNYQGLFTDPKLLLEIKNFTKNTNNLQLNSTSHKQTSINNQNLHNQILIDKMKNPQQISPVKLEYNNTNLQKFQINIAESNIVSDQNKEDFKVEIKNTQQTSNLNQQFSSSSPATPNQTVYPIYQNNSTITEVTQSERSSSGVPTEQQFVIQQYKIGSRFEGFKKNGMRNGKGKFYYQDGGYYDGEWKNNKMHGYGKLFYNNNNIAYEGQWYMDEFHGYGKVYNDNPVLLNESFNYKNFQQLDDYWEYYEGNLWRDIKQGSGKLKISNGQIFQGEFKEDRIEGKGKFYTNSGDIIKGIWKNSKLHQLL